MYTLLAVTFFMELGLGQHQSRLETRLPHQSNDI